MQFVTDNYLPMLIALFSGVMLLWSFFGNRLRGVKEIDTRGALQLINHKDALVLDVRELSEYEAGHVLNAKHIPLGKLNGRVAELEKYREQPVVVMCRSGSRSPAACAMLGKRGFAQVYNLAGGLAAWRKGNLPVEK
ncbi:MAG: rhodanese-like domain-containing protein [Pseudomonadota bacterium]